MHFKNFPVNRNNLIPFLTPTSKGTKWYDAPPSDQITNRQIGRIILQFHQVASVIKEFGYDKKIDFLDIGTGNGLLPFLISKYLNCNSSTGIDPYEDGEHQTSWPVGTKTKLKIEIQKILKKKKLEVKDYKHLISHEAISFEPKKIDIIKKKKFKWIFLKKFVHELNIKKKYNFIFAKSIDHIPQWKNLFKNISKISSKNTTLFIKHNSFFSYNGAHRYASTFIPWGHVILKEKEYENYAKKIHSTRYKDMIEFYYKGLSYPRYPLDQLLNILTENNWKIVHLEQSNKKNYDKQIKLAGGINKLLKNAKKNFPNISLSELISDRIIIIAKKI